ncbi:P27 family phage terminase small subunit [Clostridium thermarum]|uniref:P27 family phage terminase small subunit n=1 Tax=Clostridium thermarum TaxID=1716543 RepID=UPI001124010C|nr:P27 family phage terminase small subunit [Clostridium thermarum]
MAKKATKTEIKQDLLDQLDRNGTTGKYYIDLVDDYMELYDTKKKLIQDIKERGVTCKYQNGENQWGYKKNDSVDQLLKVNLQMLKLLDALGIKPSQDGDVDDDEEM